MRLPFSVVLDAAREDGNDDLSVRDIEVAAATETERRESRRRVELLLAGLCNRFDNRFARTSDSDPVISMRESAPMLDYLPDAPPAETEDEAETLKSLGL